VIVHAQQNLPLVQGGLSEIFQPLHGDDFIHPSLALEPHIDIWESSVAVFFFLAQILSLASEVNLYVDPLLVSLCTDTHLQRAKSLCGARTSRLSHFAGLVHHVHGALGARRES
jgi:hypothetical protein